MAMVSFLSDTYVRLHSCFHLRNIQKLLFSTSISTSYQCVNIIHDLDRPFFFYCYACVHCLLANNARTRGEVGINETKVL